jgi:hypothetical protein
MEQMVKTYKFKMRSLVIATSAHSSFKKDAEKLAKDGWHVASMTSQESMFNPARITVVDQKK